MSAIDVICEAFDIEKDTNTDDISEEVEKNVDNFKIGNTEFSEENENSEKNESEE